MPNNICLSLPAPSLCNVHVTFRLHFIYYQLKITTDNKEH